MEALKKTIDYIEKRTKISKKGRVLLRIFFAKWQNQLLL